MNPEIYGVYAQGMLVRGCSNISSVDTVLEILGSKARAE